MSERAGDITQMLVAYGEGQRQALDELLPLVYGELKRIAAHYLGREKSNHTLQPTALVHEAYLRLVNQHSVNWRNRAQFYGLAAQMMRRILVNYAVAKQAEKRGSGGEQVSLEEITLALDELNLDLLALDEALTQLAIQDEAKAQIVEMKFFGGMTIKEIAEVTGKSTATVEREWAFARGWLFKTLTESK
jgi:RNA polymerase sigma factor (TIGR02999 family)